LVAPFSAVGELLADDLVNTGIGGVLTEVLKFVSGK